MFVPFETAVQIAREKIARHRAAMAELNASVRPVKTLPTPRVTTSFVEATGTPQASCKAGFARKKQEKIDSFTFYNNEIGIEKQRARQPYFKGVERRPSRATIRGAFIN